MSSGAITSAPKMPDGARREARARNVRAVVAHQAPQLAREQHAQGDDAADVDQQDPQLHAAEFGRVLHALRQEQKRTEADRAPQQHLADGDPAQSPRWPRPYTGSDHVYHSETRAQSSVQKRIARMDEGRFPRRTPARTLML